MRRVETYECEDCGVEFPFTDLMQGEVCPECGGDCEGTGEYEWIGDNSADDEVSD